MAAAASAVELLDLYGVVCADPNGFPPATPVSGADYETRDVWSHLSWGFCNRRELGLYRITADWSYRFVSKTCLLLLGLYGTLAPAVIGRSRSTLYAIGIPVA